MICIPVLDRFDVSDYGLFPGEPPTNPGLHIEFLPGLTLILGANGLGKSTIVRMIYRLLVGPVDIPGLAFRTDLGTISLATSRLPAGEQGTFAQRVLDGARSAQARLLFKLGEHLITVQRRLSNLALVAFTIDGESLQETNDTTFQEQMVRLSGVGIFGEWILLLRHLVFYFEDRRALVWDPTAQRQLLRFLFLPADKASKWREDERAILEADTRERNLSAALTREGRAMAVNEAKTREGADIRKELETLEGLQKIDEEKLEQLEDEVADLEAQRQRTRARLLKAEQERESAFRNLEKAKLTAIGARFPTHAETARYILGQLLTDDTCLVCGHLAPDAAGSYAARTQNNECLVCGTELDHSENVVPAAGLADKMVENAARVLGVIDRDLAEAHRAYVEADESYNRHLDDVQGLNTAISVRSSRIDSLVKRLPPAEADLHQQRKELVSLRARVETLKRELEVSRQRFKDLVDSHNFEISACAEAVRASFQAYAHKASYLNPAA